MKSSSYLAIAAAVALATSACSKSDEEANMAEADAAKAEMSADSASNPLLAASDLQFQAPRFDLIEDSHFIPAFEQGMEEHTAEIEAIANNPEPATFENTLVAMEKSGQTLNRVSAIFFNLSSADTNDKRQEIQREIGPRLSAHYNELVLNPKLFARIKTLHEQMDDLDIDAEGRRLIDETYTQFVRAGAELDDAQKSRIKEIGEALSKLTNEFSENVLKEVNDSAVVFDSRESLAGLSDSEIDSAAEEAKNRGMEGKFVITLTNTSQQPPVSSMTDRNARKKIIEASLVRGTRGNEFDNRDVFTKIARLRAERAQLMGYANHAAYSLETQTAKTAEAVNERLASLAPRAVANAKAEAADLQEMIDADGGDFDLESWDWNFYTEKVRQARYDFDESQLKPYLELDNVYENGVFYAATKLYGITFKERFDLPVYNPDVRVWEVFDADGKPLAIFYGDFYARASKRGGAWMNEYVSQSDLLGTHSVVANHLNIPKPPEGEPTLMTWDEVNTAFHEFGHALHGMFSNVNYPSFSGTNVPRDFVEYPSQVNEMWAVWPEVLKHYAVHHETGEAMPTELLDKVLATQKFNQGYATTEYLAASLLDQAWHQLTQDEVPGADGFLAFEKKALQDAGVDMKEVPPRYRTAYFSHIAGGYSAGYYAYIWSEVLDADTVEWFKANGGLKRENGDHFRKTLLSQGGSEEAMQLFRDFAGRDPNIEPLLERRGLTGTSN